MTAPGITTRGASLRRLSAAQVLLLFWLAVPSLLAASPAPTPRLPDGHVDLGGDGVWVVPWIQDFTQKVIAPRKGEIPYLPWTRAMYRYTQANHSVYDPEGFCLPPGGPRALATPYPAQFLQQAKRIVIIFEGGAHVWREIFMDGRQHPAPADLNPTYFGHSIGHWDKDTLVIDTVGYNERTWLSYAGQMHSSELHTVERISRPSREVLHYEVLIDDPGAYAESWTVAWDIPWGEGQSLHEYICQENNQFMIDLKDDFGEPFFRTTPVEKPKP